jgi:hypothetical protein
MTPSDPLTAALDAWRDAISTFAQEWTARLGYDWRPADDLDEPWRTPPPSPVTQAWYEAAEAARPRQEGRIDPEWAVTVAASLIALTCPHDRAHSLVEAARWATRALMGWFPGMPLGGGRRADLHHQLLTVSHAHFALVAIRDEAAVLRRSQQLSPPPAPASTSGSAPAASWWHEAGEPHPEHTHGPLCGHKRQLCQWLGGIDTRTLSDWCLRGSYWAVKLKRTEYELWFKRPEDYARADLRKRRSQD